MNQIKFFRERAGMTQKQVALALRISIQSVSYWEAGDRIPSLENAIALADLFKCSLDKMLGRNTERADSGLCVDGDEQDLIEAYRTLTPQGQEYIRQQMHIAVSMYKGDTGISVMEDQEVS